MVKPEFVRLAEEMFGARAFQQDFPMVREGRERYQEYEVPAGIDCSVCNSHDLDRKWSHHITSRKTYARRVRASGGEVVLKLDDWLLATLAGNVRRTGASDEEV